MVVVQVGAVKICGSSEGAQEKGKTDETQFTTKLGGKSTLGSSYFLL